MDPRVAVVLIGANNISLPLHEADDIAKGIRAVVEALHTRLPQTRILLLATWPRGTWDDPLRKKTDAVNEAIAELDLLPYVRLMDLGAAFLDDEGNFSRALVVEDGLHLSEEGYELWASAMEPVLEEMLSAQR